jgi:hypothetical protein
LQIHALVYGTSLALGVPGLPLLAPPEEEEPPEEEPPEEDPPLLEVPGSTPVQVTTGRVSPLPSPQSFGSIFPARSSIVITYAPAP